MTMWDSTRYAFAIWMSFPPGSRAVRTNELSHQVPAVDRGGRPHCGRLADHRRPPGWVDSRLDPAGGIPASSGGEQARASYVREQLAAMGFSAVRADEVGNVIAERPGIDPTDR